MITNSEAADKSDNKETNKWTHAHNNYVSLQIYI